MTTILEQYYALTEAFGWDRFLNPPFDESQKIELFAFAALVEAEMAKHNWGIRIGLPGLMMIYTDHPPIFSHDERYDPKDPVSKAKATINCCYNAIAWINQENKD